MAQHSTFYAVTAGFAGSNIYTTWFEVEKAVKDVPGAQLQSFPTRESAEAWLTQQRKQTARVSSSCTPSKRPPISSDSGFGTLDDVEQDVKPRKSARLTQDPTSRASTMSASSGEATKSMTATLQSHKIFDLSGSQEHRDTCADLFPQTYGHASCAPPCAQSSPPLQHCRHATPSSLRGAQRDDPLLILSSPEALHNAKSTASAPGLLRDSYLDTDTYYNHTSLESDLCQINTSTLPADVHNRPQITQHAHRMHHTPESSSVDQDHAIDLASSFDSGTMPGAPNPPNPPAGSSTPSAVPIASAVPAVLAVPAVPAVPPASAASFAIEPQLSSEQRAVLERAKRGDSVFYTGSAGTGKSVLTRAIIRELCVKHGGLHRVVAVTATTGVAACNVDGTTLHRLAGIGLGKEGAITFSNKITGKEDILSNMQDPGLTASRWRDCKVLVIDEISMLDGKLFDVSIDVREISTDLTTFNRQKLEHIARIVRKNTAPFGGIQLVMTGDFYQLPPVPEMAEYGQDKIPVTFAFEAKS